MMEKLLGVQRQGDVQCPLFAVCGWRTVDRAHLGTVVVVRGEQSNGLPRMVSVDAVGHLNGLLRDHLAERHVDQLQDLLAAASGGRGEQQLVSVTMQLSAEQVRRAPEDAATDHAVEYLRRQLAVELTRRQMRPLDPWPAVTVRRLVYGMRELHPDDPQPPDLFHLELRTRAVPDTRAVVL